MDASLEAAETHFKGKLGISKPDLTEKIWIGSYKENILHVKSKDSDKERIKKKCQTY